MLGHIRFFFILFFGLISLAFADPWFTGPIIIDSGLVTPLGSYELTVYTADTRGFGIYNNDFSFISTSRYSSDYIAPSFSYGLTSDIDFDILLDYIKNQNEGQSYSGIGDTLMEMGFQLMTQKNSNKRSDLRLIMVEIFPTGRYNDLNPRLYTTQSTGSGSYISAIGLVVQHLMELSNNHYANLHASTQIIIPSTVRVNGLSSYGGATDTNGIIRPGNAISFDLAIEYSLSQNWVAVMEGFFFAQQASSFQGLLTQDTATFFRQKQQDAKPKGGRRSFNRIMPNLHNIGNLSGIANGNIAELTLAPALEYNFSENFGIIAGTWFTVNSKNTPAFISAMLTFVQSW